ncbi:MAG: VWA domain-containing protein [Acidimicrobiia bacterium]|nr:VWA domain-containing protein [Acidimicrobiia bacterium]
MIDLMTRFTGELRSAGVPVSTVETVDAARALKFVDLTERESLRSALQATMVKHVEHVEPFNRAFDVFFSLQPVLDALESDREEDTEFPVSEMAAEEISELLREAIMGGDSDRIRSLSRAAVVAFGGVEAGRPVGGVYYLYRVMRGLGVDSMFDDVDEESSPLEQADQSRVRRRRIELLRRYIEEEIRRILVADRGAEAVAATIRKQAIEDVDLGHATRSDLIRLQDTIRPLTRRLAARLAQRKRALEPGRLDVRRTVRKSMSAGGIPIDPSFKKRRVSKPDVVMLCDVSGSVSTFAFFTMQLMYAMRSQFARVRVFAFVDGVDEISDYFTPGVDFTEAAGRVMREADVVAVDGHSDYGRVFSTFEERYGDAVTPRTTLIITGDGRSNYRPAQEVKLAEIAERARTTWWLNPEMSRFWDTGDSVMSRYRELCDGVFEVRTLRQLESFVEKVSLG